MEVRIGTLLVENGVLTEEQVQRILAEQAESAQPFGLLCERLYGIDAASIEEAWADQYAALTRTIDPVREVFEDRAARLVSRRQAWQFRVLPIRFDGRELMMATTRTYLRRALGFATNVIDVPVYLVLADAESLGEALCRDYALPGLTACSVGKGDIDRFITRMST